MHCQQLLQADTITIDDWGKKEISNMIDTMFYLFQLSIRKNAQ